MKNTLISLSLVLILVSAVEPAQAFDGDRKGFMLNLGIGAGKAEVFVTGGDISSSMDEIGFGGDLKIGGGVNSQTVIYYTSRTLFYSVNDYSAVNGMSALGVSYFLEPQAPSVFFSGGLGLGALIDIDGQDSESGIGYTLGVGFEFVPNWTLEATYMRATVESEGELDLGISNLMISISWFAY